MATSTARRRWIGLAAPARVDGRMLLGVALVAASVAAMSSGGPVLDKEGGIRLVQNCGSLFCQELFDFARVWSLGDDFEGITIGNTILAPGHCGTVTHPDCFAHELVHVRQYEDRGFIGFLFAYFPENAAINAYECISGIPAGGGKLLGCLKDIFDYGNNRLEDEARGE